MADFITEQELNKLEQTFKAFTEREKLQRLINTARYGLSKGKSDD